VLFRDNDCMTGRPTRHRQPGPWFTRPRPPFARTHSRLLIFGVTTPPLLVLAGIAAMVSSAVTVGVILIGLGFLAVAVELAYLRRPVMGDL